MQRSAIRTLLLAMLGTDADDPAYDESTVLNPIIQQAVDSLIASITDANPDYMVVVPVTLTADGAALHTYTFLIQTPQLDDFARWLEIRYTDENGSLLTEGRLEELRDSGSDYFAIVGPDDYPVLITSKDSPAGVPLWMRYSAWPDDLANDSSSPITIPSRFHDVVALEALFAFGLGGEAQRPPELRERWVDRRSQLMAHVSRRGVQPGRTRLLRSDD